LGQDPEIKIMGDPLVRKWLDDVPNKKSVQLYRYGMRTFFGWLGQAPTEFVRSCDEDARKDITQKQNVARSTLSNFFKYATEEMPRKDKRGEVVGKGVSYNSAITMMTGVRSFLSQYGVSVKLSGRHEPKRTKPDPYRRMELTADQIRLMLANARAPRDRAMILVLAQGGMDLSTLCSMDYGMVKHAVMTGDVPLELNLVRRKTGQQYYTFLGKDALDAVRAYIADLRGRGVELKPTDGLWVAERGRIPLKPANVERMLKKVTVNAGIIDVDAGYNTAGGHALREWFSATLLNEGKMPRDFIDWMLGHEPSAMDDAYFKMNKKAIRDEYARCMGYLSVTVAANGALQKKIDDATKELKNTVSYLEREVERQEAKVRKMETAIDDLTTIVKATKIEPNG